jgi:glycosidase
MYQVNTRTWLIERSRELGRTATLDDIGDEALDAIAADGFDWVWLLSVWETGPLGREISRADRDLRRALTQELPDLRDDDIGGSGFAITGYRVAAQLGGDEALARLRERLRARGLRLMLDYVPNHTALDHPWVTEHPEYYVHGSELDLVQEPHNYRWVGTGAGEVLLAHGRDPYFAGWTDTAQLDYSQPATVDAMLDVLVSVSERCDGVRCDMAMLVLPDVFERTWGRRAQPFWDRAMAAVRSRTPGFTFMAEVYWDLEWTVIQLGFDDAYDKRLYDRLRAGAAAPVRDHLRADLGYQDHLARFLENHDEPRAAATFPFEQHRAASLITFLTPGLRFFYRGQLEGAQVHVSPHLLRGPQEPVDAALAGWYRQLLAVLRRDVVRDGEWRLEECHAAWDGNGTADNFIGWSWRHQGQRLLVAVNYAPEPGQCYVAWPFDEPSGTQVELRDLVSDARYTRDADDLKARGLYLDVPAYGHNVFLVTETAA